MKLATIDIGTNTTLLLVAEAAPSGEVRVLADGAEITRLGRVIGSDGRLQAESIARTLETLRRFAAVARDHGARVAAVGTEALRRAPNAASFLQPAAEVLGAPVEVIGGEREAALTFLAAERSFPELAASGRFVVVDIGGGSTEIVLAEAGRITLRVSLPLGSVRLTEAHIHHDPPEARELEAARQAIDVALEAVRFSLAGAGAGEVTLVGTAGTVTTLAAMSLGLGSYDATRVHGHRLARGALARQIDRLAGATQAEREAMPGLDPRRADVILAGALVLEALAAQLAAQEIVVSDRGVRWGLLYEKADETKHKHTK